MKNLFIVLFFFLITHQLHSIPPSPPLFFEKEKFSNLKTLCEKEKKQKPNGYVCCSSLANNNSVLTTISSSCGGESFENKRFILKEGEILQKNSEINEKTLRSLLSQPYQAFKNYKMGQNFCDNRELLESYSFLSTLKGNLKQCENLHEKCIQKCDVHLEEFQKLISKKQDDLILKSQTMKQEIQKITHMIQTRAPAPIAMSRDLLEKNLIRHRELFEKNLSQTKALVDEIKIFINEVNTYIETQTCKAHYSKDKIKKIHSQVMYLNNDYKNHEQNSRQACNQQKNQKEVQNQVESHHEQQSNIQEQFNKNFAQDINRLKKEASQNILNTSKNNTETVLGKNEDKENKKEEKNKGQKFGYSLNKNFDDSYDSNLSDKNFEKNVENLINEDKEKIDNNRIFSNKGSPSGRKKSSGVLGRKEFTNSITSSQLNSLISAGASRRLTAFMGANLWDSNRNAFQRMCPQIKDCSL